MTQDDDHTDGHGLSPLEMGIRMINKLVANGTLTEADAEAVYARTLAGISDAAQREAILRILEANGAQLPPLSSN